MNTYKVHNIYITILGLGLLLLAYISIREFLDPTYRVASIRYVPRAVVWYFVVYCWYKFMTTAYKIEIIDNSSIRTTSLIRKNIIDISNIRSVKDSIFFVNIIIDKGIISVSTLIDGVSNVKQIFQSVIAKTSRDKITGVETEVTSKSSKLSWKIFKIIIVLLLIAYAVHVELQQIALYSK